ncbi:hypothetical protein AAFF_G00329030 [Aldrovandia affinis]|uniref:Uncharacterized protein n=1 Tax=Aldrovandia affinis TaxID=143900 RepID=A0AAD7WPY8_9TELE|nr:hypothetical protein AAFF_G00329030 [Aldrovandia affinis]
MIGAKRFILIGCLLQGALGREWGIWMPQSIEALSGSCVLIPCRFEFHLNMTKTWELELKRYGRNTGVWMGI